MFRRQHYLDCNPDFRRKPQTDFFCWRCQKDLDRTQPHALVVFSLDGEFILHPGDIEAIDACLNVLPVGMDCAKKIGLEWCSK